MRKKEQESIGARAEAAVSHADMISYTDVQQRIICIRDTSVIIDADVAALYGVETRRVNEAVRNNPDKFPLDYMFVLTDEETRILRSKISSLERGGNLRSKISTTKLSSKSRVAPKAFTEKGLYMLATILKSKQATAATFAIIETFAKVRGLKRELVELHKEGDKRKQADKMRHFGETLADIVMPDLETVETESSLELNFFIGKIKHTVRRIRKVEPKKGGAI